MSLLLMRLYRTKLLGLGSRHTRTHTQTSTHPRISRAQALIRAGIHLPNTHTHTHTHTIAHIHATYHACSYAHTNARAHIYACARTRTAPCTHTHTTPRPHTGAAPERVPACTTRAASEQCAGVRNGNHGRITRRPRLCSVAFVFGGISFLFLFTMKFWRCCGAAQAPVRTVRAHV